MKVEHTHVFSGQVTALASHGGVGGTHHGGLGRDHQQTPNYWEPLNLGEWWGGTPSRALTLLLHLGETRDTVVNFQSGTKGVCTLFGVAEAITTSATI